MHPPPPLRNALALLLLTGMLAGSSCARFRPNRTPEPEWTIRPAGAVLSVDPHQHFVVFESSFRFRAGQQVTAMRGGRPVARLIVHTQSRPPFYVADIHEGRPEPGDLIE